MITKIIKNSVLCVIVAMLSATMFFTAPKQAQAAPFTCEPVFYQTQVTFLNITAFYKLNAVTSSYDLIAQIPYGINAIGYNTEDNFIYGFSGNDLVRVHNDGAVDVLGPPVNSVAPASAGDFDRSGNHYMITGGNLIKTDVSPVPTMTSTPLTGATPIAANDLVYIDGKLYGTNGTSLMIVDIATSVVTTQSLGLPNGVYGAGWASVDDSLYFGRNSDGAIFQIFDYTTVSPTATMVMSTNTLAIGNDGASCSLASSALEVNAVNDVTTTPAGQPLVVPPEQGLLINDTPENVEVTSYTQPENGVVVVNPDGSYTYTPNPGFTGTDTFTYTITDAGGNTATATVTVSVTPASPGASDANPSISQTPELASTGDNQGLYVLVAVMLILAAGSYKLLQRSSHRR